MSSMHRDYRVSLVGLFRDIAKRLMSSMHRDYGLTLLGLLRGLA